MGKLVNALDREEFQIKADEMKALVAEKKYKEAANIVDSIEWKRVKNVRSLCMAGEVLAANKRFEDSRDLFLLAYRKSPAGKTILYRLVEVSLKLDNIRDAEKYYRDYAKISPNDSTCYVLKYKIESAKGVPIDDLINILEEYKEKEYTERWSYELAKLYYKAGEKEKCIETCDDLALWFSDGKYVEKCRELKNRLNSNLPVDDLIPEGREKKMADGAVRRLEEEEISSGENSIYDDKRDDLEKEEPDGRSLAETIESISRAVPIFHNEGEIHKKITDGIKNIFQSGKSEEIPEESADEDKDEDDQVKGQINFADIIPEVPKLNESDIPPLESEGFVMKDIEKFKLPDIESVEKKTETDAPSEKTEDDFSFNLEDSILAAAQAQGIDLPDDSPRDEAAAAQEEGISVLPEESQEEQPAEKTEPEEASETEVSEQPAAKEVFSEEEELMRFIDEQNRDPNIGDMDIVPREEVLDDEEIRLFKYFSLVPGMKEQIAAALKDAQLSAADKTSTNGNIIIMGNRGCGKTMLAELLTKAICRELKLPAARTAKVKAEQLKGQDIAKIVDKLSGGFLLIQNVNQLDADSVNTLNQAMEFRTDGLTVLLEDEKISMRKFIARNPKFINKFTSTISVPVFTNDELVNFAKVYTQERGYVIDDMAILALYTLISDNQKEDEPMTVNGVKMIIDNAIAKEQSGIRKLLSRNRTDRDGNVILYEKDFK